MGKISFKNNGISPAITNSEQIKNLLNHVFETEGGDFESVSYIFCRDAYLLGLNQQYLKHDTFTDVITFTLSGVSTPLASEIYISVERVKENAKEYDVSYLDELYRVMIHGVLHLCGYSDHTPNLKAKMREKETMYLNLLDSL